MAELRKIVRRDPISDFRRVAPVGGTAFAGLAQMAKEAYEWMAPAGVEEQQVIAAEAWREYARSIMGDPAAAPPLPGAQGGLQFPRVPAEWDWGSGAMPSGATLGFPASLIQSESGGDWNALNGEGYGGRLQFGEDRLLDAYRAGVLPYAMSGEEFASLRPEDQARVEQWHFADIDQQLGSYVGTSVAGIPMTRDAIRAVAHLGGIDGARQFIESGGTYDPADSNGTRLSDYARRHGGGSLSSASSSSSAAWLTYANRDATRNDPLAPALVNALSFLPQMGVRMEVFSGGQEAAGQGGSRTGSTRHDHGNAADVLFYDARTGRQLDWNNPQDVTIFQEIVRRGRANGLTGFGAGDGYMRPGSMHVGFGDEAVWGAGGAGENAPAWLREAFQSAPRGGSRSSASTTSDTAEPPLPTTLTPEQWDAAEVSMNDRQPPEEVRTAFNGWRAASEAVEAGTDPETGEPLTDERRAALLEQAAADQAIVREWHGSVTGEADPPTPLRISVTDPGLRPRVRPDGLAPPLPSLRPQARPNPTGTPETEAVPTTRPQARPVAPETTIRTSEGRLAPRLYSPLSGPILQAYNAAAGVAFVSEAVMRGREDLMALSQQFLGNPDGFRQAAEGYLEGLVEQAPVQFREDLRAEIATEVHRRYLGMVDERYREIRERADNSSRALMDRYATDLAEAYASGRPEDIAAAEQALEGILVAREQLPGVAWTREQSQNVVLETMREGERLRARAGQERSDALKVRLQTIIDAAEAGRSAADEAAVLADPSAAALHPELYAEAQAMTALRDALPSFRSATPAEQAAAIAQERARPIGERFELGILDAMESVHAATVSALDDDPIAWAQQHRPSNPPPPLPTDMTDLAAWENALTARRDYALGMVTDGYVDEPLFFTEAERDAFTALIGDGTDPIARAAIGLSLTRAFGSQAGRVMTELDAAPVLRHSAAVVAAGGSEALIAEALRGQQLLDDNVVRLPPGSLDTIMPEDVRAGLPEGFRFNEALVDTIHALYAARAQGVDPSSQDATDLLTGAIQSALGQETHARGRLTGGVQEVGEQEAPTLLPPGISARQVEDGLTRAIGGEVGRWGAVVPMFDGQPLTTDVMDNARLVPIVRNGQVVTGRYRIEVLYSGAVADVEDGRGNIFILDMGLLTRGVPR